ncbi:MAG: hypothetical protein SV775_11020 [Thermodesulfobacteriota bacterium]|nr:hypothetical protein [Thermodesulfobacteriota bacterium]
MFSKIWFINSLLAVFAVFFGLKTYGLWAMGEKAALPLKSVEGSTSRSEKRIVSRDMPPESTYGVVVDSNLFSPDRVEFIPEVSEPEPEIKELKIPGKKFFLYGVIIMDSYKKALINNPFRKPDERPNKWVKVGDTIGDLEVAGIDKDRVILSEGAEKYEVLLYSKDKPKRQATVTKKQAKPTVVSAGPKKNPPLPKALQDKNLPEAEYEIVKTPFGNIKRRKK